MNKQILLQKLQKLGLAEIEAKLYVFFLEKGPKTPLEISREMNINRSRIYRLIESLKKKKLVEESNTSWGKKLSAADPANLEMLIIEKEEEISSKKQGLPELVKSLQNLPNLVGVGFEVVNYKGKDGLKQMLWNELKAKEVLLFGHGSINMFAGRTFGNKHRKEAFLRKVNYKEIGNDPAYRDLSKYNDEPLWEKVYEFRQIDKKILEIRHQVVIYNNTVSIMNWWGEELVGVEIVNEEYAQMQRQIFWRHWQLAK